jgi:hypothetical protein
MFGFGYTGIIASMKKLPSGGGNGALTTAWITATGETDTTIISALNTLETDLTTYGLTSKMKYLYPFVGGTAAKHKYNFMNTALKQLAFVGGWTHSSTGAQPNGTNGYADTGVVKGDWASLDSLSFGIYSRTNIQGIYGDIGMGGGPDDFNMYSYAVGGNYYRVGGPDASQVSAGTNSLGLFVGNRIDATTLRCLSNGTITAKTVVQAFTNTQNTLIGVSYANYSPRQFALCFFADGLTDANLNNLNTLVQNFQTTLLRNV